MKVRDDKIDGSDRITTPNCFMDTGICMASVPRVVCWVRPSVEIFVFFPPRECYFCTARKLSLTGI